MIPSWWNLSASETGEDLTIGVYGTIDGGLFDDASVSTAAIAKQLADYQSARRIAVHVNSLGGSLFGGLAIYNLLRGHPADVTVYVDGIAASAASVIAMAGRTVMGQGSMMMIHSPWSVVAGNAQDLRREAANLDKARESLVAVYRDKTRKEGTAIRSMLDAETWMTADQAVRNGFADEVAKGEKPTVETRGASEVVFNSIVFPRASLPAQVLAMAGEVPALPEPAPITREVLAETAPALLALLLEEGRASAKPDPQIVAAARVEARAEGVAAERARIQAIDDLGVTAEAPDLIYAAKYSDEPKTAEQVAVDILKAKGDQLKNFLARRAAESKPAAAPQSAAPENVTTEEEEGRRIGALMNRPRGGF